VSSENFRKGDFIHETAWKGVKGEGGGDRRGKRRGLFTFGGGSDLLVSENLVFSKAAGREGG